MKSIRELTDKEIADELASQQAQREAELITEQKVRESAKGGIVKSPSGKVYQWNKPTPPTEQDIKQLQDYEAAQGQHESWKAQHEDINRRNNSFAPIERAALNTEIALSKAKEMVMSAGLRGAPPAIAGVASDYFKLPKPVKALVQGGAGAAGSAIDQARLIAEGKQEGFRKGELLADTLAAANPARGAVANAGINAGLVNAQSYIDEGKTAGFGRTSAAAGMGATGAIISKMATGTKTNPEKIRRSREDETYRMARERGYLLDPSLSNPKSKVNAAVVGIAGQPQLQRQLVRANQQVTNDIARSELGIPAMIEGKNLPIDDNLLTYNRWQVSEPYRQIAGLSDEAPVLLKDLGKKRFQAKTLWRKYGQDGRQEFADLAAEADDAAEKIEGRIESLAVKSGNQQLLPELKESRRILAKNHVIDSAYNKGTGDVSAAVIGKMYDKGVMKLTDGLETIGRIENAMPQVVREVAGTQSSGGGHLRTWMTGAAGAYGFSKGGIPGALAGSALAAYGDIPVRKMAMSGSFQNLQAVPSFNAVPNAETFAAALARFAPQAAGRQQNFTDNSDLLKFLPR